MSLFKSDQPTADEYYQKLLARVRAHEGKRPYAYQDSKGYWTIGYGKLIDKRKGGGLSDDEMEYLLQNEIQKVIKELEVYAWYKIQDEVRRGVLIELGFNMGVPNLLGFKKMISALKVFDYITAGKELIDSKWARQDVGAARVADVKYRLEQGKYK